MQKKLLRLELIGMLFVIVMSIFLQNLYEISGRTLIGVMFGAVNDSIWEIEKTLLLPYIIWMIIELLCLRVPFRKFIAAKTISLWTFAVVYATACLLYSLAGSESYMMAEFVMAIACTLLAFYLSYKLILSEKNIAVLFYPAFFMILLFTALFCSLTPFPPELPLFMDRTTGLYGIIPESYDVGAVYLDSMYLLQINLQEH